MCALKGFFDRTISSSVYERERERERERATRLSLILGIGNDDGGIVCSKRDSFVIKNSIFFIERPLAFKNWKIKV